MVDNDFKTLIYILNPYRWRKIQELGLGPDYTNNSESGKYLQYIFGLPFLDPSAVGDCFAFDFGEIQPQNKKICDFADYMVNMYISEDAQFPPHMWAECSSSLHRTTNACESFHSKFNSLFYSPHPNIYQFIEVLKNVQIDTYIKISSISIEKKVYRKKVVLNKHFIDSKIELLRQNLITNFEFVKCMSSRYRP